MTTCSPAIRHAIKNAAARELILEAIADGARTATEVIETILVDRNHHHPEAAEVALGELHDHGIHGFRAFAEGIESFDGADRFALRLVAGLADVADALIEGGAA